MNEDPSALKFDILIWMMVSFVNWFFILMKNMLQLETWTFDIVLLQKSKWIGILKVWKVSGKYEILFY
jgi:hypothetical protein